MKKDCYNYLETQKRILKSYPSVVFKSIVRADFERMNEVIRSLRAMNTSQKKTVYQDKNVIHINEDRFINKGDKNFYVTNFVFVGIRKSTVVTKIFSSNNNSEMIKTLKKTGTYPESTTNIKNRIYLE